MIMFGSFLPSLGLVGTTKFTQVDGADIVMKSIVMPAPRSTLSKSMISKVRAQIGTSNVEN